jgi:hypothetical protein
MLSQSAHRLSTITLSHVFKLAVGERNSDSKATKWTNLSRSLKISTIRKSKTSIMCSAAFTQEILKIIATQTEPAQNNKILAANPNFSQNSPKLLLLRKLNS